MISLKDVHKVYRTSDVETVALDTVNLTIEEGEFLAVMGPSGCGKSTLLNILGMIDHASSGQYRFAGSDITAKRESELVKIRKEKLGFIFQAFNLVDELTVYQNVELPLLYRRLPAAERKDRVREALELVGLSHRARHKPAQLSGGQQQRVAIARAVVGDPLLVLADEPTGNLDRKNGEEVMGMLKTLNETGSTIVMVTHSPTDAAYAHRIVDMLDGKIISQHRAGPERASA